MSDFRSKDLEELIRDAGVPSRSPSGLRERTIAKAVAGRSSAHRESRLGHMLSAAALICLLAMTVGKHAANAGIAPAIGGMRPAVIHWKAADDPETEANPSLASSNESREWKQVTRTTHRRQQTALLLARCFGS